MLFPKVEGMEFLGVVGEGSCGTIYIARDIEGSPATLPDTEWYAVRVFNSLAVNRLLIEKMVNRLAGETYPEGVVPIVWKKSVISNLCMVMPMLAEVNKEKSTIAPRSLQNCLGDYPEKDAWGLIEKIARALAEMHHRHVAHGNLKPGNIFFGEKDELYLTDFAMGQMPGVGLLPFTDALLYAPPEQLREPEGYLSGKGFAWDTYAFAVLAFRLLTGKFPRCEFTFNMVVPAPGEKHITDVSADVSKLAARLEHRELASWPGEATDTRERKRREIIQRCLSLKPEDRYADLKDVLRAWEAIDTEAKTANEKAGLLKKANYSKLGMMGSLALAGAGLLGCIILASLLSFEKRGRSVDSKTHAETIANLEAERKNSESTEILAVSAKNKAEGREKRAKKNAASHVAKLREQMSALGIANDHLLAWMMRTQSSELPVLKKAEPAREVIIRELRYFLKLTEGDKQYQPIRARVIMQLAELELHAKNTQEADELLDKGVIAWTQAEIKEPDYASRLARARLVCLMQSLDENDSELSTRLLPKARADISSITAGDKTETRRINAVMKIIDGRMVEDENPAKALEYFKSAIKDLQGVHKALPDHIMVRSDLARQALHSADLADSLERVDDATLLRGEAANHLRWILKKNPSIVFAKLQLAEIEIMSAESDMRAGHNNKGAAKLATAEGLLEGLPVSDISANGVAMQIAIAKGLRSIILRDQGKITDAVKKINESIHLVDKIVKSNTDATEPLYHLAVFHWLRAGLSGDAGDFKSELSQGKVATELMERLLEKGAGKRDNELRRSLAYFYGDLGHTSSTTGKKTDAIAFFKKASAMWQSLIDKNDKMEEYSEGLKWSQSRYRKLGGR